MDWTPIALALITALVTIASSYMVLLGKKIEAAKDALEMHVVDAKRSLDANSSAIEDVKSHVVQLDIKVDGRLTQLLARTGGEQRELGNAEGKATERARGEAVAKDLIETAPHNRRVDDPH